MSLQLCEKCLQYEDACLCHEDIRAIASERDELLTQLSEANRKVEEAAGALESLIEGLDSNYNPELCGLSSAEWEKRISEAKTTLSKLGGGRHE